MIHPLGYIPCWGSPRTLDATPAPRRRMEGREGLCQDAEAYQHEIPGFDFFTRSRQARLYTISRATRLTRDNTRV